MLAKRFLRLCIVRSDSLLTRMKGSIVALTTGLVASVSAFHGAPVSAVSSRHATVQMGSSVKELRERVTSVKNTKKITSAMKLVAAAKVRRAQEAVIAGRPFAENLVQVLYGVNQRIRGENVDSPLAEVRPVKKVALVVCTGDRGLCGGFNNFVIKKAEQRHAELVEAGIGAELVLVGKKGIQYFNRRSDQYEITKTFEVGQNITIKESQAIADALFSSFTTLGVDKVEMIYTKFKSLIASDAIVQTLLPMSKEGEVCDVDGNCLDPLEDELFNLTSKDGEFAVSREKVETEVSSFDDLVIFEQEPEQILDALLPLYMNSQVLRALQESLASELAARMQAMNNASDNAKELKKNLSLIYNRGRQAQITAQIIEIVSGASA